MKRPPNYLFPITFTICFLTVLPPLFGNDSLNPAALTMPSLEPGAPVVIQEGPPSATEATAVSPPTRPDADPTIRAIELKVALQQYEKVLTALEETKIQRDIDAFKTTGETSLPGPTGSKIDNKDAELVLGRRAADLRGDIRRLVDQQVGTRPTKPTTEVHTQEGSTSPTAITGAKQLMERTLSNIQDTQIALASARAERTDSHPVVVKLQAQLTALQEQAKRIRELIRQTASKQ